MLPFSDSHFDSFRFVSFRFVLNLVGGFCSKFSPALPKVYACASQHITSKFFCNGTMQFSRAISALLETLYIFFSALFHCVFYIYSEEVIKLNGRLDAIATNTQLMLLVLIPQRIRKMMME